jgi:hypothetical protein
MIEALSLKVVQAAKALLGAGITSLLVAEKAPSLLLGMAAALVLLVTLLMVGLAVSLVLEVPSSRARPTPSSL